MNKCEEAQNYVVTLEGEIYCPKNMVYIPKEMLYGVNSPCRFCENREERS